MTDLKRPRFILEKRLEDGRSEEPRVYELKDLSANWRSGRRGFLVAGSLFAAAAAYSCKEKPGGRKKPQPIGKGGPGSEDGSTSSAKPGEPVSLTPTEVKDEEKAEIENTGKCSPILAHVDTITCVALSRDGSKLVTSSKDKVIKIWDVAKGKLIKKIEKAHSDIVASVCFTPDASTIVSGGFDNLVKTWSAKTGKELKTMEGHVNYVRSVAVNPGGRIAASGSFDGTIKLWDVKAGALIQTLEGHAGHVNTVTFSADGKTLASGSDDMTVKLWGIEKGGHSLDIKVHREPVTSVALSADDQLLASADREGIVKIRKIATPQKAKTIEAHKGWVTAIAFLPDGKSIVSGGNDKAVKIWDASSGALLKKFHGDINTVKSIAVSPDGKTIVSGMWDGTIMVWDESGEEMASCLIDLQANRPENKARQFKYATKGGKTINYTVPCDVELPAGVKCTCDCIPGTYIEPFTGTDTPTFPGFGGPIGGIGCSCDTICTCIPVYF